MSSSFSPEALEALAQLCRKDLWPHVVAVQTPDMITNSGSPTQPRWKRTGAINLSTVRNEYDAGYVELVQYRAPGGTYFLCAIRRKVRAHRRDEQMFAWTGLAEMSDRLRRRVTA